MTKTKQYWINNYYIDLSRNQIKHQDQLIQLPKKALKVLTLLAENVSNVVSHETLMSEVWTNSIVASNTLQRCIAQLRKAFGDDSKQQAIIKTHAKQGYSLEANVSWNAKPLTSDESKSFGKPTKRWAIALFSLLTLIAVAITIPAPKLSLINITPLTASDERESNASYSPDGRYLVFQRSQNSCKHHLWAKDLQTQQEYRLTEHSGIYGSHSWSTDGNQLAFVLKENCRGKQVQNCWQLQTLDFAKALQQPQPSVSRLNCDAKQIAQARWLPNGNIGILKDLSVGKTKIQSYNLRTKQLNDLYFPKENHLYSYDFSFRKNTLAAVSKTPNNEHIIQSLNLDGEVLSTAIIQREGIHSLYDYYDINYHPSGEYLLTRTQLGLYQLFFDGNLKRIETINFTNLFSPNFHPDGTKLVTTHANSDADIAIVNIALDSPTPNVHLPSIARSNVADTNGQFQPNGSLIAYISKRSGKRQLWIYDGVNSFQLSKLGLGLQSVNFSWSPKGHKVAVIAHDQIIIIGLDGNIEKLKTDIPIYKIMQWTDDNKLLVIANKDNINQIFQVNVDSSAIFKMNVSDALWANISPDNKLIYVDKNHKFWLKSDQTIEIKSLEGQLASNILKLKNGFLYGINDKNQLWQYEVISNKFNIIKKLPSTARYVSDITKTKVLITQVISYKKELIELY